MSYDGSDDEEELQMVPIVSENNNNSNVVSDSDSDDDNNNNNDNEKVFDEDIDDEIKATPKPLSCNDDNKIIEQATQEKNAIKI